jgi:hypothetical protein
MLEAYSNFLEALIMPAHTQLSLKVGDQLFLGERHAPPFSYSKSCGIQMGDLMTHIPSMAGNISDLARENSQSTPKSAAMEQYSTPLPIK